MRIWNLTIQFRQRLKFWLFEGLILNGTVFKCVDLSYGHSCSPNCLKTSTFGNPDISVWISNAFKQHGGHLSGLKMVGHFQISDPTRNPVYLQPNLFWNIWFPDVRTPEPISRDTSVIKFYLKQELCIPVQTPTVFKWKRGELNHHTEGAQISNMLGFGIVQSCPAVWELFGCCHFCIVCFWGSSHILKLDIMGKFSLNPSKRP